MRICGQGAPTHEIRWKSEKLFVDVRTDVRTDGRTHLSSNLLGHRRGDDLKMNTADSEETCLFKVKFWSNVTPSVLMVSEKGMRVPAIIGDAIGGRVGRRWRVQNRTKRLLQSFII